MYGHGCTPVTLITATAPPPLPRTGTCKQWCHCMPCLVASSVTALTWQVYLNLVLEFVPETVFRISKHYSKSGQRMPTLFVKLYVFQVRASLPDGRHTPAASYHAMPRPLQQAPVGSRQRRRLMCAACGYPVVQWRRQGAQEQQEGAGADIQGGAASAACVCVCASTRCRACSRTTGAWARALGFCEAPGGHERACMACADVPGAGAHPRHGRVPPGHQAAEPAGQHAHAPAQTLRLWLRQGGFPAAPADWAASPSAAWPLGSSSPCKGARGVCCVWLMPLPSVCRMHPASGRELHWQDRGHAEVLSWMHTTRAAMQRRSLHARPRAHGRN